MRFGNIAFYPQPYDFLRNRGQGSTIQKNPQIRSLHQVRSKEDGTVVVGHLSCYTCDCCLSSEVNDECTNLVDTGPFKAVSLEKEVAGMELDNDANNDEQDSDDGVQLKDLGLPRNADRGIGR